MQIAQNEQLSPRQRKVLRFVVEGYKNDEIARKLSTSERTIRRYIEDIKAILRPEDVSSWSRAQLVMVAKSIMLEEASNA